MIRYAMPHPQSVGLTRTYPCEHSVAIEHSPRVLLPVEYKAGHTWIGLWKTLARAILIALKSAFRYGDSKPCHLPHEERHPQYYHPDCWVKGLSSMRGICCAMHAKAIILPRPLNSRQILGVLFPL